ncbi:Uncharacterised protein [Bordetella pertussis]|nr:Uncharacterised protein [Bordetella pertussis]
MPPSVTLHASMAPVFMLCMVCSSSRVSMRPTLCRSMACPPAMPWLPAARSIDAPTASVLPLTGQACPAA